MNRNLQIIVSAIAAATFVALSPFLLNWTMSMGHNATFSVHYLAGISRIMGWIGQDELQADIRHKAELLDQDLAEFFIKYDSDYEHDAIRAYIEESWMHYTTHMELRTKDDTTILVRAKKGDENAFEEKILVFKSTLTKNP